VTINLTRLIDEHADRRLEELSVEVESLTRRLAECYAEASTITAQVALVRAMRPTTEVPRG
jgi:hypothetical protein